MKGLDGQTELGGLPAGELIDFTLYFRYFVIQFDEGFLGGFVFIKKRLTLSEVLLTLLDVEGQLILQGSITRLKQHGVGDVNGVAHLLGFLSDMPLFGQG